ncbi:MAG: hypothetical protein ACLPV2_18505 [Steroidobacteraceae bacterium]
MSDKQYLAGAIALFAVAYFLTHLHTMLNTGTPNIVEVAVLNTFTGTVRVCPSNDECFALKDIDIYEVRRKAESKAECEATARAEYDAKPEPQGSSPEAWEAYKRKVQQECGTDTRKWR